MNTLSYRRSLTVLLAGLLSGCVPSFWSQQGAAPVASGGMPLVSQEAGIKVIREGDRTTLVRQDVVLKGRLMLDDGDRQTQAAVSDVVSNATVAILDPASNVTVSTSTTDGAGNFQIPLPVTWSPVVGNTYILEAVKGLGNGAAGQRALRLRTVIQKLAGATPFASISGSASIAISPMTTAVYLRSAAGFGSAGIGGTALPIAATGVFGTGYNGTVNPSTGALKAANQFQATWSVSDAQLTTLSQMISESIAGNVDPLAQTSNPLPPIITGMSATTGPVGSVLLITGTGFSPVTGAATVSFNGTTGLIMYQSGNNIVAGVPSGATTGAVTVTTRMGTSVGATFTISNPSASTNPPLLASISKRSANVGDTLQIGGSNFVSGAGNTVIFPATNGGTVNATATYVNANQIAVAVPATAKSGPFQVSTANGVSNGYYLDVWHSSGTITEDFSTATNYDSAPSNIQWLGGASSVGDALSGGTIQTITDWDAINPDTVNTDLQNAQDLNRTYPSTIQLAYTEGSYPIANNGYIPCEEYQDGGGFYPNALATNGYQIIGLHNNNLLYFTNHGIGDQRAWFRNNMPNMPLTLNGPWNQNGTGGSGTLMSFNNKLAGLAGCPSWFYQDETVPSLNSISWVDFTNYMSPLLGNCPLYNTDNATPLLINKIASGNIGGSIYGTKMGSDGTYVYLLSGTGVVNGATVYSAPVNLYKFRPDNYGNPTRLTLVKLLSNIAGPATYNMNQYDQLIVDRRGFYYPGYNASGTYDTQALYSLRTGLSRAINVGFARRNNSYWNCGCWDSVNDEYYGGNYAANVNYRTRFLYPNYVATGSVTTGAYNLPAGTQWHSLTLVTDPIPAGATVSVNVLTGSGGAISGYSTLNNVTSISLQGANAKSQGSLKFKLTLSAPNTANGYNVTPVVRALILKTRPTVPMAQSRAIQFGSAGPNDTVVIDTVSVTQSANGGTVGLAYATSADNTNWSSFGSLFTSVNQAYMKLQVLPTESTDPTTSFSPPILRKIVMTYHY